MPVFISYSHSDRDFVDRLALQLVANRVWVWLDKWEIHAGDSLLAKVQGAINGASALLVVLSKASVKSEWCTKELNAGLMRELEEKRTVVVPVLLEKCTIPIFLREKCFADFRTEFDAGLSVILESIARVTNATQGRIVHKSYHTDWSIDWGEVDGRDVFRLTMIDHSSSQPYVVLSEVVITGDDAALEWYSGESRRGNGEAARQEILLGLEAAMRGNDACSVVLQDQMPRHGVLVYSLHDGDFCASIVVRRLGMDTGRDILVRLDGQVECVGNSIRAIRATESRRTSAGTKGSTLKKPRKSEVKSKKMSTKGENLRAKAAKKR